MQKKVQVSIVAAGLLLFTACKKSSTTDNGGGSTGGGTTEAVAKYTKKVYVEDFTGTWCGYCPDMAVSLDTKSRTTPNLVFTEVHNAAGRTDPYHTPYSLTLGSTFNITGFPTALINRNAAQQADPDNVGSFINSNLSTTKIHTGIKIESAIDAGGIIRVTTSIGFSDTYVEALKVACYLVEDSLFTDQTNYNSALGGGTLRNYLHRNVLREVANSNVLGEPISGATRDNTVTKTYNFSSVGYNRNNLKIITLVMNNANNKVYNCQIAKVGTVKDFD
jgi:thiol-disulfide isomerase/thioredoxin